MYMRARITTDFDVTGAWFIHVRTKVMNLETSPTVGRWRSVRRLYISCFTDSSNLACVSCLDLGDSMRSFRELKIEQHPDYERLNSIYCYLIPDLLLMN